MNILLLNHYAGSPAHGMEYRPYYLAREWVRSGNRVQIIAASYSHVRREQPRLGEANRPLDETIDGIDYRWLPTPPYDGNGVGRARNIAAFLRGAWRDTARLAREVAPDVVIASSTYPMDFWVARRLAKMAGARLVYEVHDLWPLSPIELGGMSPHHPFIRLCQVAEDTAYRDADVVISMLPNAAEHMAAHGLDLHKLHIVPNGISEDDWDTREALADELAWHISLERQRGRFIVGYAGSHGLPNALDCLLDAARLMAGEPVGFVLVGDGNVKRQLIDRIYLEGITNVHLFDPIPKGQIPAFLHRLDAAFLGAPKSPLYRFGVSPNKMIDYMLSGVPILFAIEAPNDPISDAQCGVSIPAGNPLALAEAVRQLMGMQPDRRTAMGLKGVSYARARYLYPALAEKFLNALIAD